MTASLLVFVSVALMVLVSGFCFVGCVLDTHGTGTGIPDPPKPYTTYSKDDVIAHPNVVAYWPLGEKVGEPKADDAVGDNDGDYTSAVTKPGLFPCPDYPLDASGDFDSALAPGDLTLGANGLVPGDTKAPFDDPNMPTTAMNVNGGFVTVPVAPAINPSASFTVECWVRPEWEASPPKFRSIIDSRNVTGTQISGFELGVNAKNQWEARLGITGVNASIVISGGSAKLSETTYVVLTFDGTIAAIFTNGTINSQLVPVPPGQSYSANKTAPLVIGVGLPWLEPRMNSTGDLFFPLFPFKGTIQCVAIYDAVLTDMEIQKHFDHGMGKPDPAG